MSRQKKKRAISLMLSLMLLLSAGISSLAITLNEPVKDPGVLELLEAIRPLGTVASVMNTAAHPDDEHSATLAKLSLGMGVRGGIVTVTRGQGGQNEIGPEYQNAMGVLRTRETQEAVKALNITLDFVREEYDSPAFDFGFSKKWEEAYEKWDIDFVTERLAYQIRRYRPDVVIIPFNNVRGTHGHHQAIMQVTVDAVKAAANPQFHPEHEFDSWQVKKVYEPGKADSHSVAIDVGEYDKYYSKTYRQLGEVSRAFHACQGMGRDYDAAPHMTYYSLVKDSGAQITSEKKVDGFYSNLLFDYSDMARSAFAKGEAGVANSLELLQSDFETVEKAYANFEKAADAILKMLSDTNKTISIVKASGLDDATKQDFLFRLKTKVDQLNKAAIIAHQVDIKVIPGSSDIIPGQQTTVAVRVHQGSGKNLRLDNVNLDLPEDWVVTKSKISGGLKRNGTVIQEFKVTAPLDATLFHPFRDSILKASVSLAVDSGAKITGYASPEKNFAILPEFSLKLDPENIAVNTLRSNETFNFNVEIVSNSTGASSGEVSLDLPEGWSANPATQKVSMKEKLEARSVSFEITPPASLSEGKYDIGVKLVGKALVSENTVQTIEYPHIGKTYYLYESKASVNAFPLEFDQNLKVGYVSTGFDTVDNALKVVGIDVTQLTPEEVRFGDLSKYDTIILGIRAYGFREDVLESNDRLLDYVKNGGNLVVQYHKGGASDKWSPDLAPYPITIGPVVMDWRITYEDSPVKILNPDHKFFNSPNKIDDKAWDGWIQERSTYQPSEWAKEYQPLVESGVVEQEGFTYDGMILTAEYGKGTYTYTTFVWFRQVPALVPGAVKLFVNIIS